MRTNTNLFRDYPDAMSLSDVAGALGISTKLASRLIRTGEIYGVKVGRVYRVAKKSVMEFLQDRRFPCGPKKYVESVTSNPKGWTFKQKCDMLCANKNLKEAHHGKEA